VLSFSLAVQRITEQSLTGKWAVSAVTLQVEGTERDVHRAEKCDDFVDQFHDFYPAIVVIFFCDSSHKTKSTPLIFIDQHFCDANHKIFKIPFQFHYF